MSSYQIQEAVSEIPPIGPPPRNEQCWFNVYLAARKANGLWLPIVFDNRADARKLAESARKHASGRYQAEVRQAICFIRATPTEAYTVADQRAYHCAGSETV